MKPHLLHVVYSLQLGGLENVVVNLACGLHKTFRQTVLCLYQSGPLAKRLPDEVEVIILPDSDARKFLWPLRIAKAFRRLKPDIVHSNNWGTIDAILAAWLTRVPIVVHSEHGWDAADPKGFNVKRRIIRWFLAGILDRYIPVSRDLQSWLVAKAWVPQNKVFNIYNGIDTEHYKNIRQNSMRNELEIPEEGLVIGTVGRLDPVKDQKLLIQAMAVLTRKGHACSLVLIGDGALRAQLEELAEKEGIQERVRFLGERQDVNWLLNGMDVFALSSIAEGISIAILEAMACGLPIVATDVGGNPELVVDGKNGYLFPPGDVEALVGILEKYIGDPSLKGVQGARSREIAVKKFSLQKMVAAYHELYDQLLCSRPLAR